MVVKAFVLYGDKGLLQIEGHLVVGYGYTVDVLTSRQFHDDIAVGIVDIGG